MLGHSFEHVDACFERAMAERGVPMVPYVYSRERRPTTGSWASSRRSLQHRVARLWEPRFTTEAHMLKPFPDRVKATRHWRAWHGLQDWQGRA